MKVFSPTIWKSSGLDHISLGLAILAFSWEIWMWFLVRPQNDDRLLFAHCRGWKISLLQIPVKYSIAKEDSHTRSQTPVYQTTDNFADHSTKVQLCLRHRPAAIYTSVTQRQKAERSRGEGWRQRCNLAMLRVLTCMLLFDMYFFSNNF